MFKRKVKILRFKIGNPRDSFVTIKSQGQAIIEATFSIVVIVGLILSMIRVFAWVGNDLSSRRGAHEQGLTSSVGTGNDVDGAYRQIRPVFYEGTPMDAAMINSEIFGSNRI